MLSLSFDAVCAILQVKLLSKEVEVYRQVQLQAVEALKQSDQLCQQVQAQLQHKEWEFKKLTAVKDNRYVYTYTVHRVSIYLSIYLTCVLVFVTEVYTHYLRIKELEAELKKMEANWRKDNDKHMKKWVIHVPFIQ